MLIVVAICATGSEVVVCDELLVGGWWRVSAHCRMSHDLVVIWPDSRPKAYCMSLQIQPRRTKAAWNIFGINGKGWRRGWSNLGEI